MNYINGKLKLEVGNKVRIREDLEVGGRYINETSTIRNTFVPAMEMHKGKIAEVIGIKQGQYILNVDLHHYYTYSMLIDLSTEDDPEFAKSDYVFDLNVENLLEKLMKEQAERALNKALEERLFETDPEQFQRITAQLNA